MLTEVMKHAQTYLSAGDEELHHNDLMETLEIYSIQTTVVKARITEHRTRGRGNVFNTE